MKVKKLIEYLEKLEGARKSLYKAGYAIGDNNIAYGLTKEDCKYAVEVIDREIERLRNIEVEI